jgi:FAD/FMN-containing dehydrogenase
MPGMTRPSAKLPVPALRELKDILGAGGWLESAEERAAFESDYRGLFRGRAALVALPDSTARVAALVRHCARQRIPIVPHGGNTGYCGGATPGPSGDEIVLSLSRMRRIRAVDAANDSMTAEAGCVLAELQAAAITANRMLPMSLGSEGSCTLGGIVSTNAGGTTVLRYGMMRSLVLGLEVVLPDGTVLDQLAALRKDNSGYDLKQLFIGAEGTLGVVTAASLRLFPRPLQTATAMAAFASPAAALGLLGRLREKLGEPLATFELVPRIALELVCRHIPGTRDPFDRAHAWYALIEATQVEAGTDLGGRFETILATAIEDGVLEDAVSAASEAQREALWRMRESIPEAQRHEGPGLKHDISVEPARLPRFIEEGGSLVASIVPDARLVAYGHAADGNLHFNVSAAPGADGAILAESADAIHRAVHELVARYGGSISAEHGIGQLKVAELERYENPAALELMRRIKYALDPDGIMNPGKVLRRERNR